MNGNSVTSRFMWGAMTGALVVGVAVLGGCQGDQKALRQEVQALDAKLTRIETQLGQLAQARPAPARARPDRPGQRSDTVYAVDVSGAPFKGPADAPVTIVKAHEFACPACESARPFVAQLQEAFGDDVRIAYKNFIVHPGRAEEPAYAACAAARQGKYDAMEALIWDEGFKARKLDRAHMLALGEKAGLNVTKMEQDMDGPCKEQVTRDHRELAAIGTRGTPTFYVNGRPYQGRRTVDAIRPLIEEELAKARKLMASGASAADVYATHVVGKGKKTL